MNWIFLQSDYGLKMTKFALECPNFLIFQDPSLMQLKQYTVELGNKELSGRPKIVP